MPQHASRPKRACLCRRSPLVSAWSAHHVEHDNGAQLARFARSRSFAIMLSLYIAYAMCRTNSPVMTGRPGGWPVHRRSRAVHCSSRRQSCQGVQARNKAALSSVHYRHARYAGPSRAGGLVSFSGRCSVVAALMRTALILLCDYLTSSPHQPRCHACLRIRATVRPKKHKQNVRHRQTSMRRRGTKREGNRRTGRSGLVPSVRQRADDRRFRFGKFRSAQR